MAIPGFLQDKNKKKNKEGKSNKGDFRQKCLSMLDEIKELSEERYGELNKVFNSRFNSLNIQKKKILGFYAQLVDELNTLRDSAGIQVKKTTKRIVSTKKVANATHQVKQVFNKAKQEAKKAEKQIEEAVEEVKTRVKKATSTKTAKKSAKKVAKKVAKKTKSAAKKVAKKTKTVAKKTKTVAKKAKTVAKKAKKKVTKTAAKKVTKKGAKKKTKKKAR